MPERDHILLRTLLRDLGDVFQRTGLPGVCTLPLPEGFQLDDARSDQPPPAPAERLERLCPIFEHLTLPRRDSGGDAIAQAVSPPATGSMRYPLKPLSVHAEDAMPRPEEDMTGYLREDYRRIWQAFLEEMQALQRSKDFSVYFFTLFFLLKKYFARVPSREHPDISIFDAARIAAAIADCRYQYSLSRRAKSGGHPAYPLTQDAMSSDEEPVALMIGVRLSGIRTVLDRMDGGERACLPQRLRGRSLYLYLLTETIAEYLMTQLDLTVAHQVWCTGGHILLVAPNIPEITYHLKACAHDLHEFMFRQFRGDLAVMLDHLPASILVLSEQCGRAYRDLQTRLDREGRRLLCAVLPDQPAWQFSDEETAERQWAEQDRLGARFPRLNQPDGRLVKKIKRADERWKEPPLVEFAIGRNLHIGWDINPDEYAQTDTIYLVNNPDEKFWGGSSARYGFKLLAAHVAPEAEAARVTTERPTPPLVRTPRVNAEEFADPGAADSENYAGVLRLDVDRLDSVLGGGWPPSQGSLARLAAISANLDFFFTGYVHHVCRTEFRKNITIAYAGDDDVCMIGAWDALTELAIRLRQDFGAFTCHTLSMSGAVWVCHNDYPVQRAAEHAGRLLAHVAKDNAANMPQLAGPVTRPDALAIFRQRLSWDDFSTLRATGERLAAAIARGDLPRSALRALLRLHRIWQRERQLNTARLFYTTARTIQQRACGDLMLAQQQHLEHDSYIPILVRYVTLKTRQGQ